MEIDIVVKYIKQKAREYGLRKEDELKSFYVKKNDAQETECFGLMLPQKYDSGNFHDFSLCFFQNTGNNPWLVGLVIGFSGFKNDLEIAKKTGLRRLFSKIVDKSGYCRTDFCDIETLLPDSIISAEGLDGIRNTIRKYANVLPACQIVNDPLSDEGKKILSAFIAVYARLRGWPSNIRQRRLVLKALEPFLFEENSGLITDIRNLLEERKFIVIQGTPGTGKTRAAKLVSEEMDAKVFFTQFHAKTSYSDFIYSGNPEVGKAYQSYKGKRGIFSISLKFALDNPGKKTVLIIDEINRANLSDVLGPVFYLFEYKLQKSNLAIEVCPGLKVSRLPDNFFVIATMNTADRTRAVKDFALRRRFAWYTLNPYPLDSDNFYLEDFLNIMEIFYWYASYDELLLMPGQGYFIADSEVEMTHRIEYELFPLIEEYIHEGHLLEARPDLNAFFIDRINRPLFE